MSCHSCRLNHVVSIVSCRVINLYFILTYFNRSGGSTRPCRLWIFVQVVASMVSYGFFFQTSGQIESNISALPVKKQHFSFIFQGNWWRLQTPAVVEDFVVCFTIRFFLVSLGASRSPWLLGCLVHRFVWSFRKFIIKLVESIAQFCRRRPEIILPS